MPRHLIMHNKRQVQDLFQFRNVHTQMNRCVEMLPTNPTLGYQNHQHTMYRINNIQHQHLMTTNPMLIPSFLREHQSFQSQLDSINSGRNTNEEAATTTAFNVSPKIVASDTGVIPPPCISALAETPEIETDHPKMPQSNLSTAPTILSDDTPTDSHNENLKLRKQLRYPINEGLVYSDQHHPMTQQRKRRRVNSMSVDNEGAVVETTVGNDAINNVETTQTTNLNAHAALMVMHGSPHSKIEANPELLSSNSTSTEHSNTRLVQSVTITDSGRDNNESSDRNVLSNENHTAADVINRNVVHYSHNYDADELIMSASAIMFSLSTSLPFPSPNNSSHSRQRATAPATLKKPTKKHVTTTTKITPPKKYKKRYWTAIEKEAVKSGVETLGVGNWSRIKSMYGQILKNRTSVNIKDCYRTMRNRGEV